MNHFNNKLYAGCVVILLSFQACSENTSEPDINKEVIPKTEVQITKEKDPSNSTNKAVGEATNTDADQTIDYKEKITVDGYELLITGITEAEFSETPILSDEAYSWLEEAACYENKLVQKSKEKTTPVNSSKGYHDLIFQLKNGKTKRIEVPKDEELFLGYRIIGYEQKRSIFMVWKNELEAGEPIMINGHNGQSIKAIGEKFVSSSDPNLIASFDAGYWTPSGLAIIDLSNKSMNQLFYYSPEGWGPVDLRWVNENTVVVEASYEGNEKNGPKHLKIHFKKMK